MPSHDANEGRAFLDFVAAQNTLGAQSPELPPFTPPQRPGLNLDELEQLEQAGTPGPWHSHDVDGYWYVYGPDDFQINNSFNSNDQPSIKANEAIIAAARNSLPALLATARNYERLLAAVGHVCAAPGVNAADAALAELARLYEALTGAQAKETPHG